MECEDSPVIKEIRALDAMEVPRPEERAVSSSLEESSSSGHENATDTQEEESEVMDLSESSQSYFFGPSTVTIRRIHNMPSLHYFTKGDAPETGQEVIPEPVDDEAIVFGEVFTALLRMPPQPTLADILHKILV
jgi:hypothetical protein